MKKSLETTVKKKSNLTAKQQLDEWKKCREDYLYFINKYVYIKHPHRGKIRFNTYEFQDDILNLITDNKDTIILKSRQMGISTIMSAYALWLMTFHDDKQIVILANKLSGAKNVIKKVKYGYRNLPEFLQEKLAVDNKAEFGFTNDSEVIALASNGDAGRGEGASLLIFDECNFFNTKIKIRHICNKKEQILSIGDLFEGNMLNEKSQRKSKWNKLQNLWKRIFNKSRINDSHK